ncbi:uncharacterized protein N7484_003288 [Penicillium longicatenatum]|uniref:uncharacterized protein n=1 Tax=Penicillium longicatenatum TaxID=1561947 RepID=UPI0025479B27|nr:uncharacterized protein N7484_003288 [Penicillium longicatenatum]KAJ5649565.1 hypothetical protein N7484_003288 [Penicillium longicatenatum]
MTSADAPLKIPRLSRSGDTPTSAERWQAITKRDTTVNSFVYGVLTTKIYCRPSCGARLARRANVEFYNTPSQAEKAGFRPCKRCRPQCGGTAAQSNPQAAMVEKACRTIRDEVDAGLKPRLHDLAAQAGLTPSHFHRVFKKILGVTPGQYVGSVVQNGICPSLGPLTPDTLSELETPPLAPPLGFVGPDGTQDLDLDCRQGFALPGLPAVRSPVITDNAWNEFDVLLAAEDQGHTNPLDSISIDPRVFLGPE